MLIGEQREAGRSSRMVVRSKIVVGAYFLLLAWLFGCNREGDPQAIYDYAYKALLHGDLTQARDEAHRECQRFRSKPEWAWRFRTLEARAALQQGRYSEAVEILKSVSLPSDPDLAIPIFSLEGEAYAKTHNFPESEHALNNASALCTTSNRQVVDMFSRLVVCWQPSGTSLRPQSVFFSSPLPSRDRMGMRYSNVMRFSIWGTSRSQRDVSTKRSTGRKLHIRLRSPWAHGDLSSSPSSTVRGHTISLGTQKGRWSCQRSR